LIFQIDSSESGTLADHQGFTAPSGLHVDCGSRWSNARTWGKWRKWCGCANLVHRRFRKNLSLSGGARRFPAGHQSRKLWPDRSLFVKVAEVGDAGRPTGARFFRQFAQHHGLTSLATINNITAQPLGWVLAYACCFLDLHGASRPIGRVSCRPAKQHAALRVPAGRRSFGLKQETTSCATVRKSPGSSDGIS